MNLQGHKDTYASLGSSHAVQFTKCENWASCGGDYDKYSLQGCDAT